MEQLRAKYDFDVQWCAFELRPEGVDIPAKPEEYMKAAWENVRRLAGNYGLEMTRNSHRELRSRLALEGQKYAQEQGKGDEYTLRVFQAMFQQDRDIADPGVLTECAVDVGLDAAAFGAALTSRRYSEAALSDERQAAAWGIQSIPCFVVGNRGLLGAQPVEALEQLLLGDTVVLE